MSGVAGGATVGVSTAVTMRVVEQRTTLQAGKGEQKQQNEQRSEPSAWKRDRARQRQHLVFTVSRI